MNVDTWFWLLTSCGLYFSALLILDSAHRAHISALHQIHDAELAGMRTYIRTLNRERKWLEAELAKAKEKLRQREEVSYAAEHIQWMPTLPPSEEYDERE